jgi:hypothetical protein
MVDAVDPFLPKPIYQYRKSGAKVASPDIILDEENISIESMTDYLFEQIGGQELLSSARSNTIDSPLNVTNLFIQDSGSFFSKDIEIPFGTIQSNLENYQIDIDDFLPFGYAPNQIVYFNGETESIVVELENLKSGYVVEVKILFGINTKFGTINRGSEYN